MCCTSTFGQLVKLNPETDLTSHYYVVKPLRKDHDRMLRVGIQDIIGIIFPNIFKFTFFYYQKSYFAFWCEVVPQNSGNHCLFIHRRGRAYFFNPGGKRFILKVHRF